MFTFQLYKDAGDDVIQLFDLSVIPEGHSTDDHDKGCSSFQSLMHKGRRESLFSLGTLLYRVAHRLSLSKVIWICYVCNLFSFVIPQIYNISLSYLEFNALMFLLQAPDNRAKCAKFFKKCLDFLREHDHLVYGSFLSCWCSNFQLLYSLEFRRGLSFLWILLYGRLSVHMLMNSLLGSS